MIHVFCNHTFCYVKYFYFLLSKYSQIYGRMPLWGSSWKLLELTSVSSWLAYVSCIIQRERQCLCPVHGPSPGERSQRASLAHVTRPHKWRHNVSMHTKKQNVLRKNVTSYRKKYGVHVTKHKPLNGEGGYVYEFDIILT